MDLITQITSALIILIRAGAGLRFIICLVKMMQDSDAAPKIKTQIKNTLIFYIIAELVFQLKDLIISYFTQSGG